MKEEEEEDRKEALTLDITAAGMVARRVNGSSTKVDSLMISVAQKAIEQAEFWFAWEESPVM